MSTVELLNNLQPGTWLYIKLPHCWRVDLTYLKPDWFLVDPPTDSYMKELHVIAGMNEPVNLDKLIWYFYNGCPPYGSDVKDPVEILFIATGEYKDKSLSDLLHLNLSSEEWKKVGQKMPVLPA
jgi:hypothetical protein